MKTTTVVTGFLLAAFCLAGCASMMGLPQGSVLVGDYKGSFDGKFFWGNIEIQVYEAPGGARPLMGTMQQTAEEGILNFRGEVQGQRVQGQFNFVDGTLTGELSPDGKTMSGTYIITDAPFDKGTWKVVKK